VEVKETKSGLGKFGRMTDKQDRIERAHYAFAVVCNNKNVENIYLIWIMS